MSRELILKVRDDIKQLMANDELVLPTLPEAALRIREIAENPNTCINDIVTELSRDPAICARILRVANSPMVRSVSPIQDLQTAISRLGMRFTSNLVISFATEQMFQATSDLVDYHMRKSWQDSIDIASAAQVLARHYTKLPTDQALLAGLIHQIGILPILTYAESHTELLEQPNLLELLIDKLHAPMGAYVLKKWHLAPELVTVAKEYQKIDREADQVDLTDLVQAIVLQKHAGTNHPLGRVNRENVGAFARIGIDAETSIYEMEDLKDELDETKAALGAV